MMPERLEQLEERVRCAVACRRYADAVRLAGEFGEAAWAYAQALPKGDARAAQAGRRVVDLFSWALVLVQGERASRAEELGRIVTAHRYSRRSIEATRTAAVHLEA